MHLKLLLQELRHALRQAIEQGLAHAGGRAAGFALTGAAVMLAAAVLCAGFGGPRSCRVSGRVTVAGQPITHGSIVFAPIQASMASLTGGQITGGRYAVAKHLMPGEYGVEIRAPRPSKTPLQVSPQHQGVPAIGFEEGVDASFNSATTLRVTIRAGRNTLNFDANASPQQ